MFICMQSSECNTRINYLANVKCIYEGGGGGGEGKGCAGGGGEVGKTKEG